ncbi:hypothetical protein DE146DRAFT_636304 [Phaeosphaeria sp. MPI-PUGE-AT-0046c]|nr:hypothetical protein DE146DRAFT_636304 [Phaeosphaeria sp. MPI-PUGE-AT-0046c]
MCSHGLRQNAEFQGWLREISIVPSDAAILDAIYFGKKYSALATYTLNEALKTEVRGYLSNHIFTMKFFTSALAVAAMNLPTSFAHWNYDRIIVNGQIVGAPYQHVRRTNNSNTPLQNVNSTDMRCNSGADSGVALNTSTYTVAAGDMLGFAIKDTFGHPGPQQVYISRAPATAADYDGSATVQEMDCSNGPRIVRAHSISCFLQSSQPANIFFALKA